MRKSLLVTMMLCGGLLFGCSSGVTQEAMEFVDYTESLGRSNGGKSDFSIISDVHRYEYGGSF